MLRNIIVIIICLFFPLAALPQLTIRGLPLPVSEIQKKAEHIYKLPSLPAESADEIFTKEASGKLKPYSFAHSFEVSLDPENSGKWLENNDLYNIWQLKLSSEGAFSIGIIFSRYRLEKGVRLFIFNEDRSVVLGALTSLNNKSYGSLAVSHIPGDFITVQMEVPRRNSGSYGELALGSVAHAYRDIFHAKTINDWRYGLSDTCHIDINCANDSAWQVVKRSVCRVVINNAQLCTGSLINNARNDGTPYVYMAAHCFTTKFLPKDAVFYFNYESPECGGPDGSVQYSVSGSTKLTDPDSLDFALVQLSEIPPDSFNIYYAGWDATKEPPDYSVCIHHPRGDVKKISYDNDAPVTSYHVVNYYPEYVLYSHWRILNWDSGTTQVGSSGSPLFNQDHRIIGSLTGGEADCVNKTDDYFTRLNYAWDYYDSPAKQLKHWLDPDSTGIQFLNGYDPLINSAGQALHQPRVRIFPNPTAGKIYLDLTGWNPETTGILVYDLTGQLIHSARSIRNEIAELDLTDSPPGIYLIIIRSEDRYFSEIISKH